MRMHYLCRYTDLFEGDKNMIISFRWLYQNEKTLLWILYFIVFLPGLENPTHWTFNALWYIKYGALSSTSKQSEIISFCVQTGRKTAVPAQDHTNYYLYFIFLQYHNITTLNWTVKRTYTTSLYSLRKQNLTCLALFRMTVAVPYLTRPTVISLSVCFKLKRILTKGLWRDWAHCGATKNGPVHSQLRLESPRDRFTAGQIRFHEWSLELIGITY